MLEVGFTHTEAPVLAEARYIPDSHLTATICSIALPVDSISLEQ